MNEETQNEVEAPVKKATKKAVPKKVAKKAAPAKKAAKKVAKAAPSDPKKAADREKAKAAELTMVQYIVLRALVQSGKPMSYRDIEAKTGYYSQLTSILRSESAPEDGNLGSKALVKEAEEQDGGRTKLMFSASATGRKLIEKVGK